MKIADEFNVLEDESREISNSINILSKQINDSLRLAKEKICNEIKLKFLEEGKNNNFEIQDHNHAWSMKYKSLEFLGNFHGDIKVIERINGSEYLKVEFVLELNKTKPKLSYNIPDSFKNQIEKKQKEIEIQNSILMELRSFKESFKESDIIIKYTIGERHVIRSSEVSGKQINYTKITIPEIFKMVLG